MPKVGRQNVEEQRMQAHSSFGQHDLQFSKQLASCVLKWEIQSLGFGMHKHLFDTSTSQE